MKMITAILLAGIMLFGCSGSKRNSVSVSPVSALDEVSKSDYLSCC